MRESLYEKHVESCMRTKVDGDTLQRALNMADNFINKERTIQWYTRHDENPKLALVEDPGVME